MGLSRLDLPTRTEVRCKYSAEGFSKPDGATQGSWETTFDNRDDVADTSSIAREVQEKTTIEYGNLAYSWDFGSSNPNGEHTFIISNKAGQQVTITAEVSVECEKITTHFTKIIRYSREPGEPGKPATETTPEVPATPPGPWSISSTDMDSKQEKTMVNADPASQTYSLTVIMQPSEFHWGNGVAAGQTIQASNALTADKWNELSKLVGQWYNWKNQPSSRTFSFTQARSGGLVTADIYNEVASILGISQVSGGATGTIITAEAFIDLETAVNK